LASQIASLLKHSIPTNLIHNNEVLFEHPSVTFLRDVVVVVVVVVVAII